MTRYLAALSIFLVVSISCTDPFNPPPSNDSPDLFVVDGFINATDSSASVTLSHSRSLTAYGVFVPEKKAEVTIKSSLGQLFDLQEQDSGRYTLAHLPVDRQATYTLKIRTEAGKEDQSDGITVHTTPAIDSLTFGLSNDNKGLSIRLNTHDPANASRYYKWEYSETFEYHAYFFSDFTFENGQPEKRDPYNGVFVCYRTLPSSIICIATSHLLDRDIIQGEELTIIPKYSPKISVRYSILVRQRTLSPEEYDFLFELRQVTERLGTFFDPLPQEVIGNIRSVEASDELVLGYFSAGEVYEQRFFINKGELPTDLQASPITEGCQLEFTCDIRLPRTSVQPPCVFLEDISDDAMIIDAAYDFKGIPYAYSFAHADCGDCRTQGGVTTRPDFW